MNAWTGLILLKVGNGGANELSSSIRCGEFLDQLLKKTPLHGVSGKMKLGSNFSIVSLCIFTFRHTVFESIL
jgi:hypothetical protein